MCCYYMEVFFIVDLQLYESFLQHCLSDESRNVSRPTGDHIRFAEYSGGIYEKLRIIILWGLSIRVEKITSVNPLRDTFTSINTRRSRKDLV